MNYAYIEIKETLKALARKITKQKLERKEMCRNGQYTWETDLDIKQDKNEFRHMHIALSLLRGREYKTIEQPRKGNEPSWAKIDKYKKQFIEKYETYEIAQLSKSEAEAEMKILSALGY